MSVLIAALLAQSAAGVDVAALSEMRRAYLQPPALVTEVREADLKRARRLCADFRIERESHSPGDIAAELAQPAWMRHPCKAEHLHTVLRNVTAEEAADWRDRLAIGLSSDGNVVGRQAWAVWLQVRSKHPSRRESFVAVLKQIVLMDSGNEAQIVMKLAVESMLESGDPSEWKPEDVVALVRGMRELDQRAKPATRACGSLHAIHWESCTPAQRARVVLRNLMNVLGKMGYVRAFELARPTSLSLERDEWVHFGDRGDFGKYVMAEKRLYVHEWHLQHPDVPKANRWTRRQRRKYGSIVDAYVKRRWRETDQAAPHPDLKRVKELLGEGNDR